MPMRFCFLTPYYPPEVGAPQTRIHELALRLVRLGHRVQVLTALPNYPSGVVPPDYRHRAGTWETLDGVEVFRTWVYATPNRGFLRRILNHLSFMVMAILAAPQMARCDVVYVESPPLFDGPAGWVLAKAKGARIFFNVADIWPRSAVELGMVQNRLLVRLAEILERWCYRTADRVLCVTLGIERDLRTAGVAHAVYFPNGVDTARFASGDGRNFRAEHGWQERFLVLYAGTHGLSQALDTVVGAASLLEARGVASTKVVQFAFIGDGAEKSRLQASAGPNVTFLDPLPRERMPDVLAAADAILVSLRDLPLFRGAVPSKTYEAMAAGKPIVLCAAGEAPDLLQRADCGVVVPPENPVALAEAIAALAQDPDWGVRLGHNGRQFVATVFDRDHLAERFVALAEQRP
ncbi:MAG: glycosyltransferase family 4 protein [Cyanobacteria bacterium REEB65]|nr:glycosyltransferase family 4 protein [Cyanobacteria bacterium REEB65]